MIFGFRGVRFFQVLCSLTALGCAIGAVFIVKAVADGDMTPLMAVVAGVLGLLFLWLFSMALRAPTSFVAVAPERTRIRFLPFVDRVVDNGDIGNAGRLELTHRCELRRLHAGIRPLSAAESRRRGAAVA